MSSPNKRIYIPLGNKLLILSFSGSVPSVVAINTDPPSISAVEFIFDSISKEGYKSKFSEKDLKRAMKEGIINEKIIALGGITLDKTPYLKSLNFGGIALSGAIYNKNAIKQLKYLSE